MTIDKLFDGLKTQHFYINMGIQQPATEYASNLLDIAFDFAGLEFLKAENINTKTKLKKLFEFTPEQIKDTATADADILNNILDIAENNTTPEHEKNINFIRRCCCVEKAAEIISTMIDKI